MWFQGKWNYTFRKRCMDVYNQFMLVLIVLVQQFGCRNIMFLLLPLCLKLKFFSWLYTQYILVHSVIVCLWENHSYMTDNRHHWIQTFPLVCIVTSYNCECEESCCFAGIWFLFWMCFWIIKYMSYMFDVNIGYLWLLLYRCVKVLDNG